MKLIVIVFSVYITCLALNVSAQDIKVRSKYIHLKSFQDKRIIVFENDSIALEFPAQKVVEYLMNDLKKPISMVKEYKGKRLLMDSLKSKSDTLKIRVTNNFYYQDIRGYLPAAMLIVAYDFLKTGFVRVKEGYACYRKIKYTYTDGPYGNRSAAFFIGDKMFFNCILTFGE